MTCAYLGGSVGSWLGTRTYAYFGWLGVCTVLALLAAAALAHHLTSTLATRQRSVTVAAQGT
jgi:predicted MFS family arabinose efflux permease